ncbi:ABC transporter substrate-binding protein [Microlunatus soli]|uniref:ABC transporter substrate-binding protein n=1 Tax=Microlunatus soli TaxID=630515 RepID=UPI0012F7833F|nr:ABC transporter substrate-binding protein [Microlunatus soli]
MRSVLALVVSMVLVTVLAQACSADNPGAGSGQSGGAGSAGGAVRDAKPAGNPDQTAFRLGAHNWASSISNNPYAATPTPYLGFTILGLGIISASPRPGANPYYPEMAESWKLDKHAVTFKLRDPAKWQDGKPFTSKDVVTSLLIAGLNYNSVWAGITSVETPDEHTVTVKLQDWVVPENALEKLLKVSMVSDAQFGQFVPSDGFDSQLRSYWKLYNILKPTAQSIDKAANSAAGKKIAAASGKLVKFSPKTLIGSGPYTIKSANVSGVLYEKWSGFWDAKKISAPYFQIYPMSTATEFGAVLGGSIDQQTDSAFNNQQADRLNKSGVAHYGVIPTPVQQMSLILNFSHYPFNLLEVRQAIAHVIDRKDLSKRDMGGGTLVQSPPVEYPDGINYQHAKDYITKKQFAKLNPYEHDEKKAASLLTKAGFTKKNGKWFTPKGEQFKFTLAEPAGQSQYEQDGLIIAGYLKKFGIDVEVQNVESGTWGVKAQGGDFDATQDFMDWGQARTPMADFAAGFGQATSPSWNYPISHSGKGPCKCGIGIGPEADVPGIGTVNIAAELNREVQQEPPETWAKYTWAWAQWVNRELPIIGLYDNAFHTIYGTSRYTKFPPQSEKWMWTVLTGGNEQIIWMQEGYLQLK